MWGRIVEVQGQLCPFGWMLSDAGSPCAKAAGGAPEH